MRLKGAGAALFVALVAACGGGEEPLPPPEPTPVGTLQDVAADLGLSFRFRADASARKRLYETMGGGVTLFDADGDGDLDVFLPGGGSAAATDDQSSHQAFFRNDGRGHLEEATRAAGLDPRPADAYAVGAAAGDLDGDGDLDLYVTGLGSNRLYRNDGGGFTPIEAGDADDPSWSTAAAFFDADGDGDDDLYVANYVVYDSRDELPCTHDGRRVYCTPDLFEAAGDRFYSNSSGRLVDATAAAGVAGRTGKGLAVAAADIDADGDIDVFVANDSTANQLWINDGRGHFTDEALLRGVALGRNGRENASMGVAVSDLDADGDLDLVVPNFSAEVFDVFRQDSGGYFTEVAARLGVATPTLPLLGFGVVAADFDLDGWNDLAFANGHINDLADELLVATSYRQPNLLLHNTGGVFSPWPGRSGDFAAPNVARGLAAGDLDGDGDLDLVASRLDDEVALYRSAGEPVGDWLAVAPQLASGAPAVGARVTLHLAGGPQRSAVLVGGGSYASQSEAVLRFGLAAGETVERIVVRWPSGTALRFGPQGSRFLLRLRERPASLDAGR